MPAIVDRPRRAQARHLGPEGVHHTEGVIAVLLGIDDNANGDEIVDLIEGLVLRLHLPVDGVKVLGPPVDFALDAREPELGLELLCHLGDELFTKAGMGGEALVELGDLFAEIFLFHFEQRFGVAFFQTGNEEAQKASEDIGDAAEHGRMGLVRLS